MIQTKGIEVEVGPEQIQQMAVNMTFRARSLG